MPSTSAPQLDSSKLHEKTATHAIPTTQTTDAPRVPHVPSATQGTHATETAQLPQETPSAAPGMIPCNCLTRGDGLSSLYSIVLKEVVVLRSIVYVCLY